MRLFSDCSGPCCLCKCADCCVDGHGNDGFMVATKDQLIKRLDNKEYTHYKEVIEGHLKNYFGYT